LSKKHFEVAKDAEVGLIVQVKSNQPTLLEAATDIAATTPPHSAERSHDKARGRHEDRFVEVFKPAGQLDEVDWKNHVETVIRVKRVVHTRNSKSGLLSQTCEVAFYVSNKELTAKCAAAAIRDHWGIETTSHYSRDVTMGEDQSRIRKNPGIFARLRSFGFNILKVNRKGTLNQDRYRAALGGVDGLSRLAHI
jgi:predicted transposase YbfD/YdcC